MTTVALFVRRQAMVTINSPRRLTVIFVLLLTIFAAGASLLVEQSPAATSIRYGIHPGVPIIAPIETQVCPGDVIHFPTVTFVAEGTKSQINIAEAWCMAGMAGGCVGVFPERPDLPLLEPKEIRNERTPRAVPLTLGPGVWHFQHSATDELGRVSGYIVAPINVVDCTE